MAQQRSPDERLKIFISYSRRDMSLADGLVPHLEASGFDVLIDRRDLPYGEEWQKELADFIRSSDAVVWVVSPDSVASKWVNWELGEVSRLSKRLVPIRARDVAPETLPEALGRIHLMPVEGTFDAASHLPTLVTTLNTDRVWLKEATRLADRARQWHDKDRDDGLILRGRALRDAERWSTHKPKAAPPPSGQILELILESRRGQVRQHRWAVAISLVAAVVGLTLAGIAFVNQRRAELRLEQALAATDTLVGEMADGMRDFSQVPTTRIVSIIGKAESLLAGLAKDSRSKSVAVRRASALSLLSAGFARRRLFEEAAERAKAAIEILQSPRVDHRDSTVAAELIRAHFRYGDALLELSAAPGAEHEKLFEAAHRAYVAGAESVSTSGDREHQRLISRQKAVALTKAGEVEFIRGRWQSSLDLLAKARAIREELHTQEPADSLNAWDLADTYHTIGDNYFHGLEQPDQALQIYQAARNLLEPLVAREPLDRRWSSKLSNALERIGNVAQAKGAYADALAAHQRSLYLRTALLEQDAEDRRGVIQVALSHVYVANAQSGLGSYGEGRKHYLQALELIASEVANKQMSLNYRWVVAQANEGLGTIAERESKPDDARRFTSAALADAQYAVTCERTSFPGWSRLLMRAQTKSARLSGEKSDEEKPPASAGKSCR